MYATLILAKSLKRVLKEKLKCADNFVILLLLPNICINWTWAVHASRMI